MQSSPNTIIVASRSDQASLSIAQALVRHHGFSKTRDDGPSNLEVYEGERATLLLVDKECIYIELNDLPVSPTRIIFVSKHRSAQDHPALTVHTTGNLGSEAKYGGRPSEVSWVEPGTVKTALSELRMGVVEAGREMEVTMEATHHGPTSFKVPVCFIEIGSTSKEWTEPALGEIAAHAVAKAIEPSKRTFTNAVGFGGTHYSARHTRINLDPNSEFAIGHLLPKHAFENGVSSIVLKEVFEKTIGGCKTALVDWDGLKGAHRKWLLDQLGSWDVEVVRL